MDTKHITAVRYVKATDPIGRLMIQTAGNRWDVSVHERSLALYLDAQIDLLTRTVDAFLPEEADGITEGDIRERMTMLIEAASNGVLDVALDAIFGDDPIPKEAPKPLYPGVEVSLVNVDGNALMLHAHVSAALKEAGVPHSERNKFFVELTSGNYDNVLATIYRWVTVV